MNYKVWLIKLAHRMSDVWLKCMNNLNWTELHLLTFTVSLTHMCMVRITVYWTLNLNQN